MLGLKLIHISKSGHRYRSLVAQLFPEPDGARHKSELQEYIFQSNGS